MDKVSHFHAGIALAALAWPFGPWVVGFVVISVASLKEVWDAQGNGTPELLDFFSTVAGGVALAGWYHWLG